MSASLDWLLASVAGICACLNSKAIRPGPSYPRRPEQARNSSRVDRPQAVGANAGVLIGNRTPDVRNKSVSTRFLFFTTTTMLSRVARSRTAAIRFASTQRRLASTKVCSTLVIATGPLFIWFLQSLRETLKEVIPAKQEQLKKLVRRLYYSSNFLPDDLPSQKADHSQTVVGDVKVRRWPHPYVSTFAHRILLLESARLRT